MDRDRPTTATGAGAPDRKGRLRAAAAGLALGLALAGAVAVLALEGPAAVPAPPPPAPPAEGPEEAPPAIGGLPLARVDGISPLGGAAACVRGRTELACTEDGGATWPLVAELPERVLAAVKQGGEVLAVTADGTSWAVSPEGDPEVRGLPPADLGVVDATARGGTVWLLAHRYDAPADPLVLPRVIETHVLALGDGGRPEPRGKLKGWAGERLLALPGGGVAIWAPFDARAWRSADGGRTFARVPASERLAADYGGLLATIERRVEASRRGREARSLSALLLSADGGASWDVALEAEGELVVAFEGPADGLAVARSEGTVYRTAAGNRGLEPVFADSRLGAAVDAARVGDRWLVVTEDGFAVAVP